MGNSMVVTMADWLVDAWVFRSVEWLAAKKAVELVNLTEYG
jgi:hypothetical protein